MSAERRVTPPGAVSLAYEARELILDMLSYDRYRRTWPVPGALLPAGRVKLSVETFYMATRMIREGKTPANRAGEPIWTAWALSLGVATATSEPER